MKKSVSLSLFKADSRSPILFSGDIDNAIPRIKQLGYDGVDLFVLDPYADISKKAIKKLRNHELGVGVVMPAALTKEGLYLGHKDAQIRRTIISRMKQIIEYASQVDAMVSLGLVRGSVAGDDTTEALLERFADSVEKLLPFAQKYGVDLVLEPINRYEINTLNSSLEAKAFIDDYQLPIYLMLDTFHMNIEDVSIEESFRVCGDLLKHVHFLDSNRLAPGMGHMDMRMIYRTLKEIDYQGYLCLEALALPDTETCAIKGMEFFRSVL